MYAVLFSLTSLPFFPPVFFPFFELSFATQLVFLLSNHFPLFIFCNDLRTFLLLFEFHGGDANVAVSAALQQLVFFCCCLVNVHFVCVCSRANHRCLISLSLSLTLYVFCCYLLRRMQRIFYTVFFWLSILRADAKVSFTS